MQVSNWVKVTSKIKSLPHFLISILNKQNSFCIFPPASKLYLHLQNITINASFAVIEFFKQLFKKPQPQGITGRATSEARMDVFASRAYALTQQFKHSDVLRQRHWETKTKKADEKTNHAVEILTERLHQGQLRRQGLTENSAPDVRCGIMICRLQLSVQTQYGITGYIYATVPDEEKAKQ